MCVCVRMCVGERLCLSKPAVEFEIASGDLESVCLAVLSLAIFSLLSQSLWLCP